MRRLPLAALAALILAACGAAAPQQPARSAVEERQTELALQGRPTLAPLAGGGLPTPTARPTPRPPAELLGISADDPRAIGAVDAPVLIVEFTDFE